jgi:hypothetical protein
MTCTCGQYFCWVQYSIVLAHLDSCVVLPQGFVVYNNLILLRYAHDYEKIEGHSCGKWKQTEDDIDVARNNLQRFVHYYER